MSKLDIDLINAHKELSKLKEHEGLQKLADRMIYYGTIELNKHVSLEHIKAVFVGLLSTSTQKLEMSDISTEAVVEFREYAASFRRYWGT